MAAYQEINDFMQLVRAENANFERWKKSSLRPLINILNDSAGNANQVSGALANLPAPKINKYLDALYYLLATYPGLTANDLHLPTMGKTNAARFTRTALPATFNPQVPVQDRLVAQSAFLGQTVEQYLIDNAAGTGVILIHLSGFQPAMSDVYNSRRVVDHMNSVLRVAKAKNCDLCILYQNAPPVCAELQATANAFNGTTLAHVHPQHMGARDQAFYNFATNHTNCVVMGFDACVCVRANLFGSTETMPLGGGYVAPVVSLTNVVTSRAVLVCNGPISPIADRGEWGVLTDT